MGLLDEAKPASQLTSTAKALFYGKAGTKKTTFTADAPKPVWFDFEKSADSITAYPELANKVMVIRVERTNPEHTTRYVLDGMVSALKSTNYQTVVIDTVDRMHSFFLKAHMEKVETEGKTLVGDQAFRRTRYLPQFQDHNLITNYLDDFFELCQASSKNVVFISHEVEQFDPPDSQGNRKFRGIRPGLTPALSKKLGELVNVVAYFSSGTDFQQKQVMKIQLAPTVDPIIAKNRLGIEKAVWDNPTWDSIFNRKVE